MSFGGFILGLLILAAGFVMVWRTNWFVQNFGDLGAMLGIQGTSYGVWKVAGMLLMVFGFLMMTGLLTLFLEITVGRLFIFGGI